MASSYTDLGTELIIIPVKTGIQKAPQNSSIQTKTPATISLFVTTDIAQQANATLKTALQMGRAF